MKTKFIIPIILGLFVLQSGNAQIRVRHIVKPGRILEKGYEFKDGNMALTICDPKAEAYVNVSNDKIYLEFTKLKTMPCSPGTINYTSVRKRFTLERPTHLTFSSPIENLIIPYHAINFGLNTLTFRYRRSIVNEAGMTIPGSVTSTFQLGFSAGYTYGWSVLNHKVHNMYGITVAAYVGPSSVSLTKDQYKEPDKYVSTTNNPTLTYGLSAVFSRNNFGLVVAYGWEVAYGKNASQWLYNYKPYFALGVNTGFGRL